MDAYGRSKTLAEKAAWDYHASLPDGERFELVVINPTLVFGPPLKTDDFTSGNILKGVLNGTRPSISKTMLALCDVRDVALAHYKAIKVEKAAGERICICSGSLWLKEIA